MNGRDDAGSDEEWTFTCATCGDTHIGVEYSYTHVTPVVQTIPCTCGAASDGIAASLTYIVETSMQESGELDETHHWRADMKEKLDTTRGGTEYVAFCSACAERAGDLDWEGDDVPDPNEIAIVDEEWRVYCAGCNRDIEFWWSHPGRGGRIWPVECSDFNPWKSWPEPRYDVLWRDRGWVRPDDNTAVYGRQRSDT